MQITKDQLFRACELAGDLQALESAKDGIKDEVHVFHASTQWAPLPIRVPVSAAAARAEVARLIAEKTEELRALGFELLPS